jgi:hypothetical protein
MYYCLLRDKNAPLKNQHFYHLEEQSESDLPWLAGQAFKTLPELPIICRLHSDKDESILLPDAWLQDSIPIYSEKLINTLKAKGATNFQEFPVEVFYANDVKVTDVRYFAVNIVGLIRATNKILPKIHGEEMPGLGDGILNIVPEKVKEGIEGGDFKNVVALSTLDPRAF